MGTPNNTIEYQIEITTDQPLTFGEDFWMYRNVKDKHFALKVANILGEFIPHEKYPTQIKVHEMTLNEKGRTIQMVEIFSTQLKDEDGQIVKKKYK